MPSEYAHIAYASSARGPKITGFFPIGKDVDLQPGPPHEALNTAAAEGWELVSVTSEQGVDSTYYTHFWLKREA
jgi:hypothetical protein